MKDEIAGFLRQNVFGRVLHTSEVIYRPDGGKLEDVYSDTMVFSSLRTCDAGLSFDMTTVTREKVYELDSGCARVGLTKDFTGTSVFRYEIALRKSSGEYTGYMRLLSSSVADHTMEAIVYGVYDVRLSGGELGWKERQLFYRDNPLAGGGFSSVAFDAAARFYLEAGKLRFEYSPQYFEVDPAIMQKSLSPVAMPSFVSREE